MTSEHIEKFQEQDKKPLCVNSHIFEKKSFLRHDRNVVQKSSLSAHSGLLVSRKLTALALCFPQSFRDSSAFVRYHQSARKTDYQPNKFQNREHPKECGASHSALASFKNGLNLTIIRKFFSRKV